MSEITVHDWLENVRAYRKSSEKTQKYAAIFNDLGIKKGDRVAFQLAKSVACLNIVAAAIQMGYIFLPLNPVRIFFRKFCFQQILSYNSHK